MKISTRIQEQIKLESSLPSEIFKKQEELRTEGYSFEPLSNFMDKQNQRVHFSIGTKNTEWNEEQ